MRYALALAWGVIMISPAHADRAADREIIASLDTTFQAAVERNDADAMAKILHDDMILVVGAGTVFTREDLLKSARDQDLVYEKQVEDAGTQIVRFYGDDVAIVTARLWLKGKRKDGSPFDRTVWFSDTYVRTADKGWQYAFGQSSIALPPEQVKR
jgi:uncharacterized protein (TIGR02246 family)